VVAAVRAAAGSGNDSRRNLGLRRAALRRRPVRSRWRRTASTTSWSRMSATTCISPPQEGQTNGSTSSTRSERAPEHLRDDTHPLRVTDVLEHVLDEQRRGRRRALGRARRAPLPGRPAPGEWTLHSDSGSVRLHAGETVIGRGEEVDLPLDSVQVSRRHARIVVTGGRAALEDLGSKSGTRLNGRLVSGPTPLSPLDVIVVGTIRPVFRSGSSEVETGTAGSRVGRALRSDDKGRGSGPTLRHQPVRAV